MWTGQGRGADDAAALVFPESRAAPCAGVSTSGSTKRRANLHRVMMKRCIYIMHPS
jgi:hypothetical protein